MLKKHTPTHHTHAHTGEGDIDSHFCNTKTTTPTVGRGGVVWCGVCGW